MLCAAQQLGPNPTAEQFRRRPQRAWRQQAPTRALFGGLFGGSKENDSTEVGLLRAAVLGGTVLAEVPLNLAYDAEKDGWNATAFHKKVDNKGPAVLIGKTSKGSWFGAFNPIGWASREDYRDSLQAFLFCWEGKPTPEGVEILKKVGGPGAAIFDFGVQGPCFGADGLKIPLGLAPSMGSSYAAVSEDGAAALGARNAEGTRTARSRLGSHYARRKGAAKGVFSAAEGIDASLEELRVYVGQGMEGDYL